MLITQQKLAVVVDVGITSDDVANVFLFTSEIPQIRSATMRVVFLIPCPVMKDSDVTSE